MDSIIVFANPLPAAPYGPGVNLVLWSEALGNWNPRGVATVSSNVYTAPDGSPGGDRFEPNVAGGYIVSPAIEAGDALGRTFTVSVWLRSSSGLKHITFGLVNNTDTGILQTTKDVTTTWQRFSLTGVAGLSTTSWSMYVQDADGAGFSNFGIWGADVREYSALAPYIPNSATRLFGLSNLRDAPMGRFAAWTPNSRPIGPQETALGTGQKYTFPFRTDHSAQFDIRNIPNVMMDTMLRLVDWLERGGQVAVYTGDSLNSVYATCCLAPDAHPTISMSDARELEYNFGVMLLNVAGTPVRMIAQY